MTLDMTVRSAPELRYSRGRFKPYNHAIPTVFTLFQEGLHSTKRLFRPVVMDKSRNGGEICNGPKFDKPIPMNG